MFSKKRVLGIVVLVLLAFTISACGKEEQSKEEPEYREDSRLYQVEAEDKLNIKEKEDLLYKLQKRVEEYSTKAEVIWHVEEPDKQIVEIYIPDVVMSDDDYQEIMADAKLEFISDYGMENQRVWIENKHIKDAQPDKRKNNITGGKEYVVKLTLNEQGTELFAEATGEMIGKVISIVYDDEVISAPVVQTVIADGNVQITGLDSWEECEKLATLFRVGKMEIQLKEIPNSNN